MRMTDELKEWVAETLRLPCENEFEIGYRAGVRAMSEKVRMGLEEVCDEQEGEG